MTTESKDVGAFVMVGLERDDDSVSKIVEILEPLGIFIEVVGRGQRLRRTPSVVFRVPHKLVTETILALELSGFPDIQAYEIDEGPLNGGQSRVRK